MSTNPRITERRCRVRRIRGWVTGTSLGVFLALVGALQASHGTTSTTSVASSGSVATQSAASTQSSSSQQSSASVTPVTTQQS